MKDIHGKAILAYYLGDRTTRLKLHNSYGPIDIMPIDVFFKEAEDFSDLENMALSHCRGTVLDIGAAAGTHALFLQSFGANVTALDSSSGCVETMKRSGVQQVIQQDYRQHQATYDTLLLLMNGIGIAGTLDQLPIFLIPVNHYSIREVNSYSTLPTLRTSMQMDLRSLSIIMEKFDTAMNTTRSKAIGLIGST